MKHRTEDNGTKVNDWETPQYIYDYIKDKFFNGKWFHDPCPIGGVNGLTLNWYSQNYINPPYNPAKLKEAFIRKAYEESKKGNLCVMLIPASTETKIFHDVIIPNAKVYLIRKRVKFKGTNSEGKYVTDKTGQTGSMFVVFGKDYVPEIVTVEL